MHLFLTSIICHVDSWATRLRVFNTTVVELKEFIELEEFIESAKSEDSEELKNCKNVQLYLSASEYLNDLFL